MKLGTGVLAIFMLASFPLLSQADASPPGAQKISQEDGEGNKTAVLFSLQPTLTSAGKAGRLYYRAVCQSDRFYPIAFPSLDVQRPSEDEAGVVAVQHIFRKVKGAKVKEGSTGIVRITIGEVPEAILRTRISVLNLDPLAQYNAGLAIVAIEQAREVKAAMRRLEVHLPPESQLFDMLVTQPAPGLPHLPAFLTNVTMDQALDAVATTFSGIVSYGACTRPRLFNIDISN